MAAQKETKKVTRKAALMDTQKATPKRCSLQLFFELYLFLSVENPVQDLSVCLINLTLVKVDINICDSVATVS